MSDPQSVKSDPRPSMTAVPIPKVPLPKHLQNEPTVTMLFPRKLSINCDNYMGRVDFNEGLQEVPVSLQEHWYLVQQGVKRYEKPAPPEESEAELVAKLKAKGYEVAAPEENDSAADPEDEFEEESESQEAAVAPDAGKVPEPKKARVPKKKRG